MQGILCNFTVHINESHTINIMRKFYIVILIFIISIPAIGQGDYYTYDSITYAGAKLIDAGISNSYFCSVKKGNTIAKYTPYEVSEYRFKNTRVFEAVDIVIDSQKERYFFERLVSGKISLYYLSLNGGISKYYISNSDSVNLKEVTLKKPELEDIISVLAEDCSPAAENLKYLKPNQHSLIRYLKDLNSCSDYKFPKIQYGFRLGITATLFQPIDVVGIYTIPDNISDLSLSIGAFVDIPVKSSNLSFAPEVYFKQNKLLKSVELSDMGYDLDMNFSVIHIPLLLKYRFLKKGFLPFAQFGPVYSRTIINRSTLSQYTFSGNDIHINYDNSPIIQKNMAGFILGAGLSLDTRNRYNWFGEIRYTQLTNLSPSPKHFNLGEFSIITGIIF